MNLEMIIQHIKVLYLYILRLLNVDVSHEYMDLEKLKIEAYRGDPEAQYQFGFKTIRYRPYLDKYNSEKIIIDGSIAIHEREAVEWIKKAANQGHENARYILGEIYEKGELTIAADEREAIGWYEKAGYQGHPKAQIKLIEMYRQGKGTRRDNEQAEEWEERAENNTRSGYTRIVVSKVTENLIDELKKVIEKYKNEGRSPITFEAHLEELYKGEADSIKRKIDERKEAREGSTEKEEALERSFRSEERKLRELRELREREVEEREAAIKEKEAKEIKEREERELEIKISKMSDEEKAVYKKQKARREQRERSRIEFEELTKRVDDYDKYELGKMKMVELNYPTKE